MIVEKRSLDGKLLSDQAGGFDFVDDLVPELEVCSALWNSVASSRGGMHEMTPDAYDEGCDEFSLAQGSDLRKPIEEGHSVEVDNVGAEGVAAEIHWQSLLPELFARAGDAWPAFGYV